MPAKSKSQERLMQAVAHNPAFAKKVGISQKVGKEFVGMAKGGTPPAPEEPASAPKKKWSDMEWNPLRMPNRPLVPEPRIEDEPPPKAAPVADQGGFFTAPSEADKAKRRAGPPASLTNKRFASGGSIDGCAQRGKTRLKRS